MSNWRSQTAYSSAVRRGSVAIRQRARMLAAVHQREDDIGVPGIDREQHRPALQSRKTSPAWMTRPLPSAKRSLSAPSSSSPSNRPSTRCRPAGARSARCRAGARARASARGPARSPRRASAPASARRFRRAYRRALPDRAKRRARPGWWSGGRAGRDGARRLTPKPMTTASPARSSRMPATLAPPSSRSLGHLMRNPPRRRSDVRGTNDDRFLQRYRRDQRQRRRRRIAGRRRTSVLA